MTGPFLVVFQLVKYIIKYGSLYYFYLQAQKKLKENEQLKQQWSIICCLSNKLFKKSKIKQTNFKLFENPWSIFCNENSLQT